MNEHLVQMKFYYNKDWNCCICRYTRRESRFKWNSITTKIETKDEIELLKSVIVQMKFYYNKDWNIQTSDTDGSTNMVQMKFYYNKDWNIDAKLYGSIQLCSNEILLQQRLKL